MLQYSLSFLLKRGEAEMKIVGRTNNTHRSKPGLFLFLFPSKGWVPGLLLRLQKMSAYQLPQKKACVCVQTAPQRLFSCFPWHTWSEVDVIFLPHRLWGVTGTVLAAPECPVPYNLLKHKHTCSGNTLEIRAAKNKVTLCCEGFYFNSNLLSLVNLSFPVALTLPSGIGKSRLKEVIY